MAALVPMAMYGLEVPAGDVAIPSKSDIPAAFRITMAAIDPSAEPEGEDGQPPRATLKIIRQPIYDDEDDEDDDSDFDLDEMDRILAEGDSDEDSEDDDEVNGGPSEPAKTKQARKEAARKQILEALEQDSMEVDAVNGEKSSKAKGKLPVGDESEEDSDDDDDDEEGEFEEFVICTLDPTKNYQQPLDLTIGDDERVWFKVSGTHSIFLTGNYVEPLDGPRDDYDSEDDDDEDDEYDLEPDSDEILSEEDEDDELDDLENPRITEVEDEEEAPKLVEASKKADKKGKNKRAADESEGLDALIAKAESAADGDKLSKKQQKKIKKNDGTAVAVEEKKEVEAPSKSDKKVQFAKQLEQGPTPTKASNGTDAKPKATLGVKTVQGVTIDDKKLGTGPAAKAGDRVGMRYIGKLKDGKVFDSNKKGKPFSFKLSSGEVIKGWDIGISGMSVGGERRITIPAHLGYGSKGAKPDIPPNATLVFDVKLIDLNKGR